MTSLTVQGVALFLDYINDRPANTHSNVRVFADGTTIYNSATQHPTLQENLEKLMN